MLCFEADPGCLRIAAQVTKGAVSLADASDLGDDYGSELFSRILDLDFCFGRSLNGTKMYEGTSRPTAFE